MPTIQAFAHLGTNIYSPCNFKMYNEYRKGRIYPQTH